MIIAKLRNRVMLKAALLSQDLREFIPYLKKIAFDNFAYQAFRAVENHLENIRNKSEFTEAKKPRQALFDFPYFILHIQFF